jgi:hypothetical protein
MGICTECFPNEDGSKECSGSNNICNSYGKCVECIKNEDDSVCTDRGLICDERGTCVECDYYNYDESQCNNYDGKICTSAGFCAECNTDDDCKYSCDPLTKKCVKCVTSDDCNNFKYCLTKGGVPYCGGSTGLWTLIIILIILFLLFIYVYMRNISQFFRTSFISEPAQPFTSETIDKTGNMLT